MKKFVYLFITMLVALPIYAVTLEGKATQNISSIKCSVIDDYDVSIKVNGYPYPPHKEKKQNQYDLIIVIDDTNKKIMDMYMHDNEFSKVKVTGNNISFHKTFEYNNYKADNFYDINRLTGTLYGYGTSDDNSFGAKMSAYHSLKGTCEHYKIEKKF